jgi:hypothetical protein
VDDLGRAEIVGIKIASVKEKAQCVFWFHESKSPLKEFSEISDVSMDDICQMSEVSQVGVQSLKRLAILVTVK